MKGEFFINFQEIIFVESDKTILKPDLKRL
jgi:hypothetical protein